VREQEGALGGGERLLRRQVPARRAVHDAVSERRLAHEQVGTPCEPYKLRTRRGVVRIGDRLSALGRVKPVRLERVMGKPVRDDAESGLQPAFSGSMGSNPVSA
jgi:hypothetical protein